MYLVLENEILSPSGEYVDSRFHSIHVTQLTNRAGLVTWEDYFCGFIAIGWQDKVRGTEWRFNEFTEEWEEVNDPV
jgi:hypothetical protein